MSATATLAAAAILGIALLLGYQALVAQQRSAATSDALGELGRLRDTVLAGSVPSGDTGGQFPFQVVADTGAILASSASLAPQPGDVVGLPVPPAVVAASTASSGLLIGNGELVVPAGWGADLAGRTLPYMYADLPRSQVGAEVPEEVSAVRIVVVVTPFATDALLTEIRRPLLVAMPLVLLVLAAVVWWSVGRALRPVAAIRRSMDTITAAAADTRVDRPRTGDEVEELAVSVNTTLDRLAAADRRQRAFVSDAAHELRSPIAALQSTLDVARLYPDHVDPAETAAALARQVERLARLSENLLALSRLEADPDPAGFASGAVVDVTEVVRRAVDDHPWRTTVDVVAVPVPVVGDPTDLGRAVTNLLTNADRHAARRVTVSVTPAPPDDGTDVTSGVEVVVANDGPPIPEDQRERIFDRLHRLDEARSLDAGGSGLGLAITRRIAERHGGWVRAENTGGGVVFRLWLPAAPVPVSSPAAGTATSGRPAR